MKAPLALAAVLLLAVSGSASAGNAVNYSGRWPVTVTQSERSDATYCLVLTDDGSRGWPHSGAASLPGHQPYGTFKLINRILVATIQAQGFTGQNAGLVFSARASGGNIDSGFYETVYGGEDADSGVLTFGPKGGC